MRFYKRLSLYLSMGIMGIGLVTFSMSRPGTMAVGSANETAVSTQGRNIDEAAASLLSKLLTPALTESETAAALPTATPAPVVTDAPTATPIPPNDLQKDKYPSINALVSSYYEAKLECSLDRFKTLVTDASAINIEKLQLRTEYIKSYDNMTCYTKWVEGQIDFVVYVTYEMEFPTIESMGSAIDELYVVMDENDSPLIYLGEISSETAKTLSEYRSCDEVTALVEEVNDKNKAAIANDESLADFFKKLQQQ